MDEKARIQRRKRISKKLSWILRHGAKEIGLSIRDDGFVSMNELLRHNQMQGFHANITEIREVVDMNDKKRFEIVNEGASEQEPNLHIRAVQGHSITGIDENKLLRQLTMDDVAGDAYSILIHGTRKEYLDNIILGSMENSYSSTADTASTGVVGTQSTVPAGLSRCTRNHIHLSLGFPPGFEPEQWRSIRQKYPIIDTNYPGTSVFDSLLSSVGHVDHSLDSNAMENTPSLQHRETESHTVSVPVALSGIRGSTNAIIFVDIRRAMAEGIKFFQSSNDVVLCPGASDTGILPSSFFLDVVERHCASREPRDSTAK